MAEWVYALAGDYAYQFMILLANELQFLAVALLFCWGRKHRKHFGLRVLFGTAVLLGLTWVGAYVRTIWTGLMPRLLVTVLQYGSTLPLLFLCLEEPADMVLKTWCSSVAVKEIGGTIYPVLQFILGYNSHETMQLFPVEGLSMDLQWLIYYAIHFLIYYLLWRIVRKSFKEPVDARARRYGMLLSLAALLILGILGGITSHYRDESTALYICARMFSLLIAVFILMTYSGIEFRSRSRQEMAAMEHILSEERKQYAQMKENIDIINMHCHDLKHQLAEFSGKLTDQEIVQLQEAMDIYDNNIRTGCEALDVALYVNQLACQKEGIRLSCLADGKALSFMRTRHVYALFSNILRNAMEAVRKLEDPDQRIISMHVEDCGDRVEISETNYFVGDIRQTADSLLTTKGDTNHHGFGTMSMKYTADQYHGHMGVDARNGIFRLLITLPKPKEKK